MKLGSSHIRSVLAAEGLIVEASAADAGLKKALAAWKNSFMWENDQAKRKGKNTLVKRVFFTSAPPDFSSLVDEINKKFFTGSGYKVEVSGPIEDVRNPPKQDYSEKNFSYQEYKIVPDGAQEKTSACKTASSFNAASPFAKKLEDLVGVLFGSGSWVSVGMGKGEFSGKVGMKIIVVNPNEDIFPDDQDLDDFDGKQEALQEVFTTIEDRLSQWFGMPVHTEGTDVSAVTYLVELPVRN